MQRFPNVLTGIALMVAAMWCFACMNIAIRALAETMPSPQMVALRNVLSLSLIVLWIAVRFRGFSVVKTDKRKSHFWRSAIGLVAMELWFYSLSIMPVTLATALGFTTPIFATIFAIVILKEQAGWRRWLAVAIGFIGVWIILRPDSGGLNLSASVVLLASAFMALAGIVMKTLTRTERPETIVFYMALIMSLLSWPLAVPVWQGVAAAEWQLLLVIALFSTAAQLLVANAFRHAELVVLLPFDYTRLVFTAILAYMLFGEVMDDQTILGTLVIMASSIYIVHRERVRRRQASLRGGEADEAI